MNNNEEIHSQPLTRDLKLRLANFVLLHKNVLFARHNSSVRQTDKNTLWKEIHSELVAHGAVLKDANYVRDRAWDNLRSGAIKKKKKLGKTGAAGGDIYTEYDRVTLDIIDPQSAYMAGIQETDTAPRFPGATPFGGAMGGPNDRFDDTMNTTIQSVDTTFSTQPGTSQGPPTRPMFAMPRPLRTSSPVGTEVEEAAGTQARTSSKRKRGPPQTLWTTDAYKDIKVKQMEMDVEEKQAQINLIRMQLEESRLRGEAEKERAEFFRKAGIALENTYSLQINREFNLRL